ncbi:MAG: aminoacyl--tRNA ligase-related protein [bacterium]|nr:aminoacyl--tRNA ligase-related protein [bacterium]
MKFSQLFTKTRKEAPRGEGSRNAELLIRAGYIDKLTSGVYSYLPLGLIVLKKIEQIIREEMNAAGGQEILMPALHPKENWVTTGRWDKMDDLYKVKDKSDKEFALGPTHEEVVVPLVKQFVNSYKDLPLAVYQFQNKFRMELRAKSGLLRGREFIMKDFYSFHADEKDLAQYYEKMKFVYQTVFKRVGLGHLTYLTYASGGSFSKYSHEFQTITPAGEDTIYLCDKCLIAINKEIKHELEACPQCGQKTFREEKAIEVGNIFELKTKFTDPFEMTYKDKEGKEKPVVMGCYGIGLGRVMGTIVEVWSDEAGIRWPDAVAPFKVHLISLGAKEGEIVENAAEALYTDLTEAGIETLWDDRDVSAGNKLAEADLLGCPWRVVLSEKTLQEGKAEIKERGDAKVWFLKTADVIDHFKNSEHLKK